MGLVLPCPGPIPPRVASRSCEVPFVTKGGFPRRDDELLG